MYRSNRLQKNKPIANSLKKEILLAMQEPYAVLAQIASKYGVSRSTLYAWKKLCEESHSEAEHSEIADDYTDKFIELSVKNSSSSTLQKASFTFRDYSFSIEGEIKSKNLMQIMSILEEAC